MVVEVDVRWWDWAVLVVSTLSLLGLCFELVRDWWQKPPSGWGMNIDNPSGPITWFEMRAVGAEVMYEPVFIAHGCTLAFEKGVPGKLRWSPGYTLTADSSAGCKVLWAPGRPDGPAMVEVRWVSAANRRTSPERVCYLLEERKELRWKRYRVPRLHAAPGRWVEMKELPEDD